MNNFKADKFIRILEERNNPDHLLIILVYYLYKSYADINDEAVYKKFSDILFKNLYKITDSQKNSFFDTMISRLLDKVNSGKPEFLKELFRLYNIKLKLGLYNELRVIRYPSLAFRDYIIIGLKLKKNKWVENFIKKYSELKLRLNPDKKEIGYFLNKVSETPNLIAKDWFIEKIREMKI